MRTVLSFDEWESAVPERCRQDRLWRMAAYRLAVYARFLAWDDACAVYRSPIARSAATQLYGAVGSIAANLAEGYSRSSGPDRVRFFEYALGSSRESREWYHAGQPILGAELVDKREDTLDQVCRILLTAIPEERKRRIHRD